jgi:uncharacterized membrane protein YsdA (DUF1294 family)
MNTLIPTVVVFIVSDADKNEISKSMWRAWRRVMWMRRGVVSVPGQCRG